MEKQEPRVIIRRLNSRGDEVVVTEMGELARVLPDQMRRSAAAVRVNRGDAKFVGSDPALVQALVRNEVAAGAEKVEVLLVPRIKGG